MTDTTGPTFEDRCLISCGMLYPEIHHLRQTRFLNARRVLFTPPGLHALPHRLEEHLLQRLAQARESCSDRDIIVVYGSKCYVDADDPLKRVDTILQAAGPELVRVKGDYGYDMLAGFEARQQISGGRQDRILWFTPGWLRFRHSEAPVTVLVAKDRVTGHNPAAVLYTSHSYYSRLKE